MSESEDGIDLPTWQAPLTTPSSELFRDPSIQGCSTLELEGVQRPAMGGVILLSKLGQGGMATVFYGRHPRLQVEVAVKVISRAHLEGRPNAVDRFIQEAQIAARLHSEHLVHVYDVDRDEQSGLYFIVMEFVHGPNASEWARQGRREPVTEIEALDLCLAATNGLAVAHRRGIIHRDIKPGNILIPLGATGQPDPRSAKLSDLGLARFEEAIGGMTRTEAGMGTPGYMAPEQIEDARSAGRPADVFGLGATLYSLLVGRSPFASGKTSGSVMTATLMGNYTPLREMRPDASEACIELVERCLQVDPTRRFDDATALQVELGRCRQAILAGGSGSAGATAARRLPMPPGSPSQSAKEGHAPRSRQVARGMLTLLAVAALAVVLWQFRPAPMEEGLARSEQESGIVPSARAAGPPGPEPDSKQALTEKLKPSRELPIDTAPIGTAPSKKLAPAFDVGPLGTRPVVANLLVIEGRALHVQEGRHVVRIGGEAITLDEDGKYRHPIDVRGQPEGSFRLSLEILEEPSGEVLDTRVFEAVIDRTAPRLERTSPGAEDGHYATPSVPLAGIVHDEHGPELLIDGVSETLSADDRFETTVELQAGQNKVSLVARDAAGNEKREDLRLVLDQDLPTVLAAHPIAPLEAGAGWRIEGRVKDAHPAYLLVDDQRHELSSDGAFDLPLPDGWRTLSLVAVDLAGNQSPPRLVSLPVASARPTVTVDPHVPTSLDPTVVLRGKAGESTTFLTIEELDLGTGEARDLAPHLSLERNGSDSVEWRFELGLPKDKQRKLRITAHASNGEAGERVELELSGAVEIGVLEEVDEPEAWAIIRSTEDHKDILKTIRVDVDRVVLEDGSLLLVTKAWNKRNNRTLTTAPLGELRLSTLESKRGQQAYLLARMSVR